MSRADDASHEVLARSVVGFAYVVATDGALREAMAAALRADGWHVLVFRMAADLLARLEALAPGCIVSGLCVTTAEGGQLMGELAERGYPLPVVVLAAAGDVAAAVKAMKAGAADVVALPLEPGALSAAVRGAMAGWTPQGRSDGIPEAVRLRLERLTRRERQVLDAIVRGDGNKAIAHELGISPRTVEVHRAKVMEKLSCRSLPDVIRLAIQAGLLRV